MRRTVNFLFRLLACSLIALPVSADETVPLFIPEPAASATTADSQAIPVSRPIPFLENTTQIASLPIPEVDTLDQYPTVPAQTCQGGYWIVSSRGSVQSIHEACRGPWGLNVYQRLPSGQLVGSNISSMRASLDPNLPVCIFSHGSFVTWESQCRQAHALYQRMSACYGKHLQMVFFTWPSDGPKTYIPSIDVAVRARRADFNGFHFAYLISQVPESCPVTLMGHSHGVAIVLSALHLAGGGAIEGHYFPYSMGANRRYRAVLAAGAIDHNWLNPGQRYGCALNRLECLLNLRNRHDLALAFYPLSRPFAVRALARSGFTNRDYEQVGYNAGKIREVDVTAYLGVSHQWPDYFQQTAIVGTIVPYLNF